MKKRLFALLLAFTMILTVFSSCSKEEDAEEVVAADAEEVKEEATYKIAMIVDSTIADGGWGAACYNAMISAAEDTGFETQYTDGLQTADFASSMRSYADLGFDMIFAPGNQYSDAVKEVAEEYPDVKFALLNGVVETDNIVSILPDAQQIGYMAGALAGLMSETNNIGFIGGLELDTTKMKLESYEVAAKKVNPDITVYSAYAGSFSDTAKGKEIAKSMISLNDVDIMFGDASAVDSGAREVLSEYDNKYDVGQPSDLNASQESDIILNSVVTDNATMLKICMEDMINGTYGNKTIYGNLENGSLSVGTYGSMVSEEIQEEYAQIIEEIQAGTFVE